MFRKNITVFVASLVQLSIIISAVVLSFKPVSAQVSDGQNNPVRNGLKVSANNHFLVDAVNRKPVFILATTAWNINALTYGEIDTLIKSISGNGFNSMMFALDFYPQADEANVYGDKPYIGPDKTDLNPAYFTYCDYIVSKCNQYGIYPMIYTMWSGKTTGIMNTYSPDQLYRLGKKIGARYKEHKNVILVAGGESSPPYIDTARVNAMGKGLREGSEGHNLISVHPCSPHSGSEFYSASPWADFDMVQEKSNLNGITYDFTKLLSKGLASGSNKPIMLAEQRYETGTSEDPVIQRRNLYLAVFAGGFGFAYGHNALWQMTPHTAQPWMLKSWAAGVSDWKQALNTTAQQQLQYIKKLLEAFPYLQRVPDQSLLLSAKNNSIINKVELMRDGDIGSNNATYIMAHLSSGGQISINTAVINSGKLDAWWFDPRTGSFAQIVKGFRNRGRYDLLSPTTRKDWVLIIADARRGYPLNYK